MEEPKATANNCAEPTRRFLDPFWEMRDHANQWDMSELMRKPAPSTPAESRSNPGTTLETRS